MGLGSFITSIAGDVVSGLFSAREASKQRDFQKKMSDTSYQRAVKDLEAAGLNPMLAYSQGGASTPAGAQGSIPTGIGERAVNASRAASMAPVERAALQATTLKTEAERQAKIAEIDEIASRIQLNCSSAFKTQVDVDLSRALASRAIADTRGKVLHNEQLFPVLLANTVKTGQKIGASINNIEEATKLVQLKALHSSLGLDKAQRDSELYSSSLGGPTAVAEKYGGVFRNLMMGAGHAGAAIESVGSSAKSRARAIWNAGADRRAQIDRDRRKAHGK